MYEININLSENQEDIIYSNKEIFEVIVDGEKFKVEVILPASFQKKRKNNLINNPVDINIPPKLELPIVEPVLPKGEQGILAPMPGILVSYGKKIGDEIKMGDAIVVLEAMKMYNNLYAPCDGIIKEMPFKEGENVKKYDLLCLIEVKEK
ncbi:MAG: acetyl-CoA carboxylase biotin carboxyl carrier protein subunit [Candidatus Cloacimonetes bacterium]|nr:acetyl-CoA carboxylase biotin carboxyl carrier protein subunit [Candidatus Cloacimonadota bacterium]